MILALDMSPELPVITLYWCSGVWHQSCSFLWKEDALACSFCLERDYQMASNATQRPGSPEAEANAVPAGGWYRFTNMFLGEGRSLDTYGGDDNEPFMGDTGNYSGQYWKITSLGLGYFRLTNMFLGEGRSLDTYSNAGNEPFMGNTGNYSGQYWQFTPLSDGYFRMTNMFLGSGRSLDTYSDGDNEPFMGNTGNYSGQYWKITLITGAEEVDLSSLDVKSLKPSVRSPKS
jgi:hypothetical protein